MSEHILIGRSRSLAYGVFGQALTRELVYLAKRPYRWVCQVGLDRRYPFERSWRSAVPLRLQLSMQRGFAGNYRYKGIAMLKSPIDLALYNELLWELKPLTIIEVGSKWGGSAIWFADHAPQAEVYSIDVEPPSPEYTPQLRHPHVKFLRGDQRNLERVDLDWHGLPHPWLVVDDASHRADWMLPGMLYLDGWMQRGDYFVVEDGNAEEAKWYGKGGPSGAIWRFLKERPHYRVDGRYCDKFGYNVTNCPNGWLIKT